MLPSQRKVIAKEPSYRMAPLQDESSDKTEIEMQSVIKPSLATAERPK